MFKAIAEFAVKLFGKNLDFFTGMFTRRVAMVSASLTMIATLIAILFTTVGALFSLMSVITPQPIEIVMSWVIPSNMNGIVTVYLTFRVALAVYKFQLYQIRQITSVG